MRHFFDDNGVSDTITFTSAGKRAVILDGSDGGGTTVLQLNLGNKADDSPGWTDFTGASWTAAGLNIVELPAGQYRFKLTGATTPSLAAMISDN